MSLLTAAAAPTAAVDCSRQRHKELNSHQDQEGGVHTHTLFAVRSTVIVCVTVSVVAWMVVGFGRSVV